VRLGRAGIAGVALIVALLAFCFLGPLAHPTNQLRADLASVNSAPAGAHLLGTDANGFDIFGRLMVGGRDTLIIALAVGVLATALGAGWGAFSGYLGGWPDAVMMRIVDSLLAVPAMFVLIYLGSVTHPTVLLLILVISLLSWLSPARLIRSETLSLRTREFVQSSRAMGASAPRLVARHVVPNTIGTIVVSATFQVADAIILLATLSFLGFGLAPPAVTWGGMLSQGTSYLLDGYWWQVYPVGLLIMLTVIAFNLVGDALRSALDVRLQQR
jgi:peptide/nickel transport system permease protein